MWVLSTAEREQLAEIVAKRVGPRKHLERARLLGSADRRSAQRVAQSIGVSRAPGDGVGKGSNALPRRVEGLLRDKTRKPRKAPVAA
jgi:hypothetical protein